jgi:TonB-dependent receptor
MRKTWCLLVNLVMLLLLAGTISATQALGQERQERKGTVTGRVTDSSHAVLPGARVELQPKGHAVATDTQGQFTIPDVPSGEYKVIVTYVGFAPFETSFRVTAGEIARVDAVLEVRNVSEEMIVKAERPRGEAEALNIERTADNIVQVLPAEVITSLPNTNVADAVGRLPGVSLERDEGEGKYVQIRGTEPRLSNVTINGVNVPSPESVRNVKLDVIPADLVQAIAVNKTLSANQDGDAIGGSVNLITRTAVDEPFFSLNATGGYTPIVNGRGLTQVGSTYGRRFGADKRFGFIIGGGYDYNARGIDDVEPAPGTFDFGHGPVPVVFGEDIREYWYYRHRFGFAGSADYRLGPGSDLYVRGLFSQFKDYGEDWIYSPSVGNFLTPTTSDDSGTMGFSHVFRRPQQQIFSIAVGGVHTMGATLVNYEFAVARARQTGGFGSASFSGPQNVAFGLDVSNPLTPKFPVLNGVNIFDPTTYMMTNQELPNEHTNQLNLQGYASVSRQYNAGSHIGTFEVGMKIRNAHKTQEFNNVFLVAAPSTNLLLSQVLTSFTNSDYYHGVYKIGPVSSYDKINAFINANPGSFTVDVQTGLQRNLPNDWDTQERVYAGYAMNTINLGNFRLQTGVRVESTQSSFTGNHLTLDADGNVATVTKMPGDHTYTDVLPSVQLRYGFDQNTDIRLAYGRGIARPDFADLPPFIVQDDFRKRVSVGNPNLVATHAHNFDLLFEHFLPRVGVIQVGGFYKDLSDPIYSVQTIVPSGTFAGFQQTQSINGSKAHITGVEAVWEQRLSFLPGGLSGLGLSANYSYTSSRAAVPGRSDHPTLLRTAPNNWNLNITYDWKALSARVGLTHNDANIFAYNFSDGADGGIKGPNGDVYLYAHTQLDAQASYSIKREGGLKLVVSLLNLNNEVFGFYQGSTQFPIQREFYNRTFMVGLRWVPSLGK